MSFSKKSTIKFVQCESCGKAYAYEMLRSALSIVELEIERQRRALHLPSRLERSCDPVPCPECGWYQREMVKRLRKKYLRWLKWIAWALVPIAIALLAVVPPSVIDIEIATHPMERSLLFFVLSALLFPLVVLAGAPILFLLRLILSYAWDPNAEDVEIRKRLGQARAIGRIELEKMQQGGPERKPASPLSPSGPFLDSPAQMPEATRETQTLVTALPPPLDSPGRATKPESNEKSPHAIQG